MTESKELDLVIATLDREFGQGTVVRLGTTKVEPWPAISTGALTLDLALGIGGLPKGRVVEIYGPESSGKTTVALNVIAQAQAQGGTCAFVDVEHALDPVYAQALGVNLDDLLFSQPDYGEAALEVVDRLVRTGEVSVVVVDSVAALVPKAELEGSMGDSHMGLQPRLMSQAMRKLVAKAHETKTLIIFTNQLREKIGIMFGNPETTTGGRALKFYSSIRIDIRRVSDIKDPKDGLVRGVRTKAKVVKNKLAPALRIAEFDIIYGRGIDVMGCLLDAALGKEIFTQKGGWLYYNGESFANGRVKAIEALASDLDFADALRKQVKEDVSP